MIRQNWKELTFIQIGGAICLPLLLIGFEIGRRVSFVPAVGICLLGNGLLTLLAVAIGKLAVRERKTTSECIASILGSNARRLASGLLTVSMLSWFSIQTEMIVQDVLLLFGFEQSAAFILTCLAILLMVSSCLYGLKSIERLSRFATPLMAITLLTAVACKEACEGPLVAVSFESLQQGLLVIVGGTIMAIIDLPTFFRTAHSEREITKASIASFLVGVSFVEIMGAWLSSGAKAQTLMETLLFTQNYIWTVWIALFIFLAGWTTNVANLYSGGMALTSLLPKVSEKRAILILGAFGLVLSQVQLLAHIEQILEAIAVTTIALGAELARVAFMRSVNKRASWIAVVSGTLLGIVELVMGKALLGSSLLDVFIVTLLLSQLLQNKMRYPDEVRCS